MFRLVALSTFFFPFYRRLFLYYNLSFCVPHFCTSVRFLKQLLKIHIINSQKWLYGLTWSWLVNSQLCKNGIAHGSKKKKKSILWLWDDDIPTKFLYHRFLTQPKRVGSQTPQTGKVPVVAHRSVWEEQSSLVAACLGMGLEEEQTCWGPSSPARRGSFGLPRSSSSVLVFITLTSSAQLKERKSTLNFSALATCPATPMWHMFLQFPCLVFWQGRCQTSPAVAPQLQVVVARSPGSVTRSVGLLILWCELLLLCTGC